FVSSRTLRRFSGARLLTAPPRRKPRSSLRPGHFAATCCVLLAVSELLANCYRILSDTENNSGEQQRDLALAPQVGCEEIDEQARSVQHAAVGIKHPKPRKFAIWIHALVAGQDTDQ